MKAETEHEMKKLMEGHLEEVVVVRQQGKPVLLHG